MSQAKNLYLLFGILMLGFWISGAEAQEEGISMKKKAVMIIPAQGYRDEELAQPKAILEAAGIEVKVASTTFEEVKGMLGGKVKPDILISDISVANFDAIIFVGGMGAEQYWNDPLAHQLARSAFGDNKIVAAICIAPVTLANAGILSGKRAAVSPSEGKLLIAKGAKYTGRPLEVDGNVITAAGPAAATDFGDEIVKALRR